MQKSFKSLFSIYSLQNFVVVDNQNTQLKNLHRLLFFLYFAFFFRSYFMTGKLRLRNVFSRQILK